MTKDREDLLIQLLGEAGAQWSPRLYNVFAKMFALTALEAVFLRTNQGKIEVLLIPRDQEDQFHPGMWHSPGTMVRATDSSGSRLWDKPMKGFEASFQRLLDKEIGAPLKKEPIQVESQLHHYARATENALIWLCELDGEPRVGKYFQIDNLPDNMIDFHREIVRVAVEVFKKSK